jgi:hypothetical protein
MWRWLISLFVHYTPFLYYVGVFTAIYTGISQMANLKRIPSS